MSAIENRRALHASKLRSLTLELRLCLDRIAEDVDQANELLSAIEEAAGLVRDDGSRIDEPTAPAQKGKP